MLRKTVSGIMLALLLMGMLALAFSIQPVEGWSGTVYIRADGSIDPPDAPISTVNNVTYTLTGNITNITINADGIVVERSHIIIDGAGYTVEGAGIGGGRGFFLSGITNVTIKNTNIKHFWAGIWFQNSNNNTISGNNITNNTEGIRLFSSSNNTIVGNNITENNDDGIWLGSSSGNKFYHNNFINNTKQVRSERSVNVWDDGYPSGGNYWSDYNGTDADTDGVGDTPYVIDENNTDNYPLIGYFSDFNATSEFHVQTICNSTISDFQFNGTAISFNVSGEDGTSGFCRICIPTALMNDTIRVFVNGTEILPSPEPLPCSNSTHSYLYFTYEHSTQEVVIIPEFPSALILPLFALATLIATILFKKKRKTKSKRFFINSEPF